ncbi:hypothetical protein TTHERM_00994140 (macronuclear) [Tetrahymena thermophila SB210]|uniref:Transmembrane protein n=1 Tax=Tetrahymena thermophila (strain SB210) TaxID=312017 RepID=Q247T3_TETTS|nr:hypothetical protein TTHERM_00994140 [Tetrahymena thermophila SB210]EAS04017.2 hypothetical protein TTHERM_00994140 [Tetrahymena thermophila SB210]|eukprot:XP_001024262.2 hypothetical protein TTHERM_00994140 [Tetrahymena thermophila SB210]
MQHKRYFLILLLLTAFCQCQVINKRKQLNLQNNELYLQSLSDFINEPATQINWPSFDGVKQILKPFQILQTYQDAQPIKTLAVLDQGEQVKYIIGYTEQATVQSNYQLSVVYQKLTFDSTCQCLVQTNISQQLETVSSIPELFFGSFYNFNSGFISYTIGFAVKTYRFQITSQNQFQLDALISLKLYHHVSIQGTNGSIYVIQYVDTNQSYYLIKLDASLNVIFTKETQTPICDLQTAIVDTGRFYFNYCYFLNNTSLIAVSINFINETLSFQKFDNISQSAPLSYVSKRIGNFIMIALYEIQECTILKLKSNESINDNVFNLISNIKFPKSFQNQINFINQNLLGLYSDNILQLFDQDRQQTIYQTQVDQDGFSIQSVHSLGNQMFLYLFDSFKKYSKTLSVQVYIPSFTIQLTQSTTSPIQFSVVTVSQTTFLIEINVNIVQQNTVLFVSDQVTKQKTIQVFQDENVQLQPIEDQVIGSDLQLNVSIDPSSQQYIKNASFIKIVNLPIKGDINSISQSCIGYQTDGFFSTLFVCPSQQMFNIIAAQANSTNQNYQSKQGLINTYKSLTDFPNTIKYIDNQGSFTLEQSQSQNLINIYLPYLNNQILYFTMIPIQCTDQNFQFASDPAQSVFFTYCNNDITLYLYTNSNSNQIISKTVIISNQYFNELICIDGILFAYNAQTIYAYNYIQFGSLGQITIPTEGNTQQLTLFKSSFLVTVIDNPLTKIAQYSYNNFSSQSATFIRYLQIDSSHPINIQGIIIAKRSEVEIAYILSTTVNQYYIYRVNSQQWSNQLYAPVSFNLPQTVISGYNICQMNPLVFQQVLKEASVKYELNLTPNQFNTNHLWSALFALSLQKDQNQSRQNLKSIQQIQRILQTNQVQYTLLINRDASAAFGNVNQQSEQIQQLKTQIQDIQVGDDENDFIFNFKDYSVYNACLTGWQNSERVQIIPRIDTSTPLIGNQVFTILYNQRVQIQKNQISSFFTIQGNFNDCIILDDKASLQSPSSHNYSFTLYIICQSYVSQYQIQYQIDENTGQISNSNVSDPVNYFFDSKILLLSNIKEIISYNQQFYLYFIGGLNPSLLILNSQLKINLVSFSFIININDLCTLFVGSIKCFQFYSKSKRLCLNYRIIF